MGVNVGGLARMPHMQALWSAKLHPCDKKVVFSDIIYIDDTQTTRFEGGDDIVRRQTRSRNAAVVAPEETLGN